MGASTPAIHQVVHNLAALGLLEIAPNPRSGRSKLVMLTPEGFARRRPALELLRRQEEMADTTAYLCSASSTLIVGGWFRYGCQGGAGDGEKFFGGASVPGTPRHAAHDGHQE